MTGLINEQIAINKDKRTEIIKLSKMKIFQHGDGKPILRKIARELGIVHATVKRYIEDSHDKYREYEKRPRFKEYRREWKSNEYKKHINNKKLFLKEDLPKINNFLNEFNLKIYDYSGLKVKRLKKEFVIQN